MERQASKLLLTLNPTTNMLTPKEIQIIEYGKANGKTPQESIKALERYRMSQPQQEFPQEQGGEFSGTGQRIKGVFNAGKQKTADIATQAAQGKITKGEAYLQEAGTVANTTLGTVFSLPGLNKISEGFNWIVDKADKLVKSGAHKFVESLPEETKKSYRLAPQDMPTPEQRKRVQDNTQAGLDILNLGLTAYGGAETLAKGRVGAGAVMEQAKKGAGALKQGASATIDTVGNVASKAKNKVVGMAEKPIPAQVQDALKGTKTSTFDEYAETAKKATESFKNKTPLELAGEKAQGALDTVQRKLDAVGEQKSGVMNQAAVGNKPVGNIALKYRQGLNNFIKSENLVEGDRGLLQRIAKRAEALGSNPSAKQVDQFIDYVQNEIYSSKRNLTIPVTDSTTGALRKLTGELNESLKSQLPDSYRNLNQKYSELIEVRNELNSKLGYEGEKGGSLMKRVFSPSDAGTKKLFQEVLKLTGVDLINEATMAKFLMETLGDARQISMLEKLQLPSLSPRGNLQLAKDWLSGKLNTPEKIIQRARELTKQN